MLEFLINHYDENGFTKPHYAIILGAPISRISLLLEYGANPRLPTKPDDKISPFLAKNALQCRIIYCGKCSCTGVESCLSA